MKHVVLIIVCSCLTMPYLAFSQDKNEARELAIKGPGVIDLLEGGTLGDWYARPSLRIFPDQAIINQAYKPEK